MEILCDTSAPLVKARPRLGPQIGRPGREPLGVVKQREDLFVPHLLPASLVLPAECGPTTRRARPLPALERTGASGPTALARWQPSPGGKRTVRLLGGPWAPERLGEVPLKIRST